MNITICNFAGIPDRELARVCAAINRQISEHFAASWNFGSPAQLQVLGAWPERRERRGDAIIYLWDAIDDVPRPLADDDPGDHGLPFGFVIKEISEQLEEPWSVTLSREALALIGDAHVHVVWAGPHPADPSRLVFHWYEMCDAVEAETYEIDDVAVSSFLLPSYFVMDAEQLRTDFLHRHHPGGALRSFGVNPGGSCGLVDLESKQQEIYASPGDELAAARLAIKRRRLSRARRSARHRSLTHEEP